MRSWKWTFLKYSVASAEYFISWVQGNYLNWFEYLRVQWNSKWIYFIQPVDWKTNIHNVHWSKKNKKHEMQIWEIMKCNMTLLVKTS